MNNILENFIHKKPRCLKSFEIEDLPKGINTNWSDGPEFLSKLVKCKCGNNVFNVYASSNEEMTLAPVYLECPNCLTKDLIFDPTIHGWDGENGDCASLVGEKEPQKLYDSPRKVIIDYSYQGVDSYAELIDDGIENPEDYFDVFIINTLSESGKLEEVVSYECA